MSPKLMTVVCSIGFFVLGAVLMLAWKDHEEERATTKFFEFKEDYDANNKMISEDLSILCTKINDPSYMRVCFHLKDAVDKMR